MMRLYRCNAVSSGLVLETRAAPAAEQKRSWVIGLSLGWVLLRALGSAQTPSEFAQAFDKAAQLEKSGDLARASAAYRALLPMGARDEVVRARVLGALALVETNAGDYPAAMRDAETAAEIYGRHADGRAQARALNTAGLAALYAGKYDDAAARLTRAIALSSSSGDTEGRAEQLTNLANVHFFTGRYTDAFQLYDDVLQAVRAAPAAPWSKRRTFIVNVNRGALEQRLGRNEEALAIYQQLAADSIDLRPREQAQVIVNEGVVYRNLGDPIKALTAYNRALDLFARDQHLDGQLGVLKNRGIVQALDLHDLGGARRSFSDGLTRARAAGNRREALQAQLYRAEAELRDGAIDDARTDFEAAIKQAEGLRTPEEIWKALYGLGRVARATGDRPAAVDNLERAAAVIESIREGIRVPALRSDFFNDKRDVYDALIAIELENPTPSRLFDLVERSHSRAWRERLGFRGHVALAAVQQAMPPDVALLDYWSSAQGAAVVVVTRDRADVRRVTVDTAAIQRFSDALGRGPSPAWRAQAAAIAIEVLPEGIPAHVRHVIVVPDGALPLLPFDVLQFGSELVLERAAVSYMPTAAMILTQRPRARRIVPPWRRQLSAFADPVPAPSQLDDVPGFRERLTSSRSEVEAIAKEITGATFLRLGVDDQKAYLAEGGQAPILHVASHAVADSNAVERSRILFSPAAASRDRADYLFLKEAYELRLNDVDLVVLSACETERGRILRGEGVQSFSRAFLAAGARSTVTTLWRVPDASTASFMTAFYLELTRGVSRAEALRTAKLRFLRSESAVSDPHFWGAFVLTGDGIRPIEWPIGWGPFISAAAAALFVAYVGLRLTLRRILFR